MIPRLKPNFSLRDWLAIFKRTPNVISQFEATFANQFGCQYGVMFSYGRTALYALFKVFSLHNAEIICPAYTCVVVAHAIVLSGNIPVFVDCAPESFNMSLEGIRQAITPNTRAIILTHLFGYPMDVEAAERIVREAEEKYQHKIYVIQDVAHSYGAYWQDNLVTTYGDAAIFGMNISKMITTIFGGMVITNNEKISEKLRSYQESNLKKTGSLKNIKRFIYFFSVNIAFQKNIYKIIYYMEKVGLLNYFVKYFTEDTISFPKDWDHFPCTIEAKVGLAQLSKYKNIVGIRQENAKHIINTINRFPDIKCLTFQEGATYSHLVALVKDRNTWVNKFKDKGVQLGTLIEYSIPYLAAYKKYRRSEYPISKWYAEHTINFPVWDRKLSDVMIKILKTMDVS